MGAHLMVNDGEKIKAGKILIKIPRKSAKKVRGRDQEILRRLLATWLKRRKNNQGNLAGNKMEGQN
ncbi:hypothetical protein AWY89_11045 [Pasteurella multocida subsp. multocida]|nr:hypothetical protein AWY89_11045 [Pasteurella multocida subsp. multocida]